MRESMTMPYRHPLVRDLAWVMSSPSLLRMAPTMAAGGQSVVQKIISDETCAQIYRVAETQLCALDENPAPLLQALAYNTSHRLGGYFENLLRYWLEQLMRVEGLRHNVPVFETGLEKGNRTLGEFDFLFRLGGKIPLQHWEATVKFYLLHRNEHGEGYWLGPGGRDRLDVKLERMFGHQLTLAQRPQAGAAIGGVGATVEANAFIKGYLFYPLDANGERQPLPEMSPAMAPYVLSENHLRGWWLHWRASPLPQSNDECRWLVLPKSRWLSPARQTDDAGLLDSGAAAGFLESHFRGGGAPLLLAELSPQNGVWEEVARGFVLPPR